MRLGLQKDAIHRDSLKSKGSFIDTMLDIQFTALIILT